MYIYQTWWRIFSSISTTIIMEEEDEQFKMFNEFLQSILESNLSYSYSERNDQTTEFVFSKNTIDFSGLDDEQVMFQIIDAEPKLPNRKTTTLIFAEDVDYELLSQNICHFGLVSENFLSYHFNTQNLDSEEESIMEVDLKYFHEKFLDILDESKFDKLKVKLIRSSEDMVLYIETFKDISSKLPKVVVKEKPKELLKKDQCTIF